MVSLKQKQSGFTIVELLIVIVIIGILAGLVITTFVGVQQRARDAERQTDVNAVAGQMEGYFATYGGYPATADVNNATWRSVNNFKLDAKALADPSTPATQTLTDGTAGSGKTYYLTMAPASCVSPTKATATGGEPDANTGTFCTSYTLTANLEAKTGTYVKTSQ